MIWFYMYMAIAYCVSVYGALALTDEQKRRKKGAYFVAALIVGFIWPILLIFECIARVTD